MNDTGIATPISKSGAHSGEIPDGWRISPLSEVATISKKPHDLDPSSYESITFVPMDLISDSRLYLPTWDLRSPADIRSGIYFTNGDVLLAKITPCLENGKQCIVADVTNGWGLATTEVFPLHPIGIDSEFLALYLKLPYVRQFLTGRMEGTTGRQRLPRPVIEGLPILIPPREEQHAIADVLLAILHAKESTERVIASAGELKLSVMRHLFTYGPVLIHDTDRIVLKETEVGPTPEGWAVLPLKEVATIGYGVQAAVAHLKDPAIGTPILTNINITIEGTIDLGTMRYYALPEGKRDRFVLRKGDVLFNWRSGSQQHVGKSALFALNGEYTHSSFILRIRCGNKIRPEFLASYLHFLRSRGFFVRNRQQSSVNSVFNKSISETIPVVLPPPEVQDKIVETLTAVDEKISLEKRRQSNLEEMFRSLLYELMDGKRRIGDPEPIDA